MLAFAAPCLGPRWLGRAGRTAGRGWSWAREASAWLPLAERAAATRPKLPAAHRAPPSELELPAQEQKEEKGKEGNPTIPIGKEKQHRIVESKISEGTRREGSSFPSNL